MLLLLCILPYGVGQAQIKPIRRILIINEVNTTFPGIPLIDDGIRSGVATSTYQLEVYREYLDTVYFPDPADQQRIQDFIIRKYQDHKPDVIITVGPSPLKFMEEKHQLVFSGVPIVFCLPYFVPSTLALDPDFTGVDNDLSPRETMEAALRLQPHTKHIVVVGGMSVNDKRVETAVRDKLGPYEGKFDISYLTQETMPNLLQRLKHLPQSTVVLYIGFGRDAAGTKFVSGSEGAGLIVGAANAPVFSLFDVHLNHGEVGGKVSNLHEQGRVAGVLALRVLSGERPQNIPFAKAVSTYMFDWRALRRWGLSESHLPPGSIVLNREPTLWDSYKWYIVGGVFLLLAQTSLILGLSWQRATRRKAEGELALTYDRLRLAVEAAKAVGWDWDIKTGQDRWFGDLQNMFGIPSDTFTGRVEEFHRRIHPEDRERVGSAISEARKNHTPYTAEFRVVRVDQSVRWITARGKFYYRNNGDAERMMGMAVDITDRKLAEEVRFRHATVVESSPDAIISKNLNGVILSWNAGAQRLFGYSETEVIGQPIKILIPADRPDEENYILGRLRDGECIEQFETTRITKAGKKDRGVANHFTHQGWE
jgi:PAS domain S-box-containing protein